MPLNDELTALYRGYAAQCVLVARNLEGEAEKLALLDMAQAWHSLAHQAERNQSRFVAHQTPDYQAPDYQTPDRYQGLNSQADNPDFRLRGQR